MGYRYKNKVKQTAIKNLCLVIAKCTRDSIGFFSFIQLGIEWWTIILMILFWIVSVRII